MSRPQYIYLVRSEGELFGCFTVKIRAYRRLRRKPVPFWSEVGRLTSHGSGYSAAICWHYGYHPDTGEKLHA